MHASKTNSLTEDLAGIATGFQLSTRLIRNSELKPKKTSRRSEWRNTTPNAGKSSWDIRVNGEKLWIGSEDGLILTEIIKRLTLALWKVFGMFSSKCMIKDLYIEDVRLWLILILAQPSCPILRQTKTSKKQQTPQLLSHSHNSKILMSPLLLGQQLLGLYLPI